MSEELERKTKISVIIPAAGAGKRMKSYGPKSLIKVGKSTIVSNQIHLINSHIPDSDIVLVCGFKSEKLMNETPSSIIKIENELYEETNVVRSIGMGLRATGKSDIVIVIYGDLVFNEEMLKSINTEESSVVIDSGTMSDNEVGCIINEEGYLESIMYDLPDKWAQVLILKGQELKIFRSLSWDKKNYRKFGFEIINEVIKRGGSFKALRGDNIKVIDIDNSKDIPRAKEILL